MKYKKNSKASTNQHHANDVQQIIHCIDNNINSSPLSLNLHHYLNMDLAIAIWNKPNQTA